MRFSCGGPTQPPGAADEHMYRFRSFFPITDVRFAAGSRVFKVEIETRRPTPRGSNETRGLRVSEVF